MAEQEASATSNVAEVRLSREMRLFDVVMIGVGAMIGAGIFVLTGIAAGIAGPGLLLAFLLNAFVTLFAASAYAELGSSFHTAGGSYLWVKLGLRDPQGFMSGWMDWFAHAVACSLYALGFGAYFKLVLPLLGVPDLHLPLMSIDKWLAVGVIALFAYINYRGASETGGAGNLVTVGKILVLAVFIGFGIWVTLRRPDWRPVFTDNFLPNGMGSVFVAMGLTFIAFEGYEIIAQCSEEVQQPARNVPRAIFLSLLVVVPIYLLVAFAALGSVQVDGMPSWKYLGLHKETALVDVARTFFPGGGIMMLIGGVLSTISALNATIYSSSRVSLAMGRDRNLPSWFGRIHPTRKTPHGAIAGSAVLIAFMAVALPIEAVASAANIMFLLLFIQVQAVLIALRKQRPHLKRGFRVPWVPFIPVVGIALQVFLAIYQLVYSPLAWLSALVWIALGFGVYYGYARKRDSAYEQVVEMRAAAQRKEYRILACVHHTSSSAPILQVSGLLATALDGELIALTVVEVPDGELLAQGMDSVREPQRRLSQLTRELSAELPVRSLVKISHRVSFAICESVLEEQCNMVVIGSTRRRGLGRRFAAAMVNRVIREAPAQTMVVSAHRWPERVTTVLYAHAPSPHARLTLEMASQFATVLGARLRAVHVLPVNTPDIERQRARQELARVVEAHCQPDDIRLVIAADVVSGIVHAGSDASLLFVGGSDGGLLENLLGFSVPHELAERASSPVITVYEMPPDPRRWLTRRRTT